MYNNLITYLRGLILGAILLPFTSFGANLVIPTNGVVINGQYLPSSEISSMGYVSGNIQIVASGWTLTKDGQLAPTTTPAPTPVPIVPSPAPTPVGTCTTTLVNSATPKSWRGFWGVEFPLPGNDIKRLDIGRSGYNYIKFNTGNANGSGVVYLLETTTSVGIRFGSISRCPGDFNVVDVCKKRWGINAWIPYTTSGAAGRCQLNKNTTYYLNFTFTDGKNSSTSTCKFSKCIVEIQARFRSE